MNVLMTNVHAGLNFSIKPVYFSDEKRKKSFGLTECVRVIMLMMETRTLEVSVFAEGKRASRGG